MLKRRFVNDQFIHLVLRKETDPQLARVDRLAIKQHQTVGQKLGQRRFTLTVFTQQRDTIVLVDPQIQARQHRLAFGVSGRPVFNADDRWRQLVRLREGKDLARGFFRWRDRHHLFDGLHPRLGLFGLGRLGLKAVNECLHVLFMRLLLFRLRGQLCALFGPHFRELIVITLIIRELTVFEVQDATNGAVQQTTVVADDDHRMRVFRQVVFQP